jgi:hypothetical protein
MSQLKLLHKLIHSLNKGEKNYSLSRQINTNLNKKNIFMYYIKFLKMRIYLMKI